MIIQMSLADYVSLVLAAAIVSLVIFREVRDINIGKLMMMQARARDDKRRAELGDALDPKGAKPGLNRRPPPLLLSEPPPLLRLTPSALRMHGAVDLELDASANVWAYLLGAPVAVRRYFILPFVLETVVVMVLRMGGDTVSVMLNTMATLCAATDHTRAR